MRRRSRREYIRPALRVALAIAVFVPLFLFVVPYSIQWADHALWCKGLPFSDTIVASALISLWFLGAYLPARFVYALLRWPVPEDKTAYCESCGYDLTGNESGVCPECGTKCGDGAEPAVRNST